MIENIFSAEAFARPIEGIYDKATPEPIAPTNIIYTDVKTLFLTTSYSSIMSS
jgi:hypothetical protein